MLALSGSPLGRVGVGSDFILQATTFAVEPPATQELNFEAGLKVGHYPYRRAS